VWPAATARTGRTGRGRRRFRGRRPAWRTSRRRHRHPRQWAPADSPSTARPSVGSVPLPKLTPNPYRTVPYRTVPYPRDRDDHPAVHRDRVAVHAVDAGVVGDPADRVDHRLGEPAGVVRRLPSHPFCRHGVSLPGTADSPPMGAPCWSGLTSDRGPSRLRADTLSTGIAPPRRPDGPDPESISIRSKASPLYFDTPYPDKP
jgi:hypothetical protein